MLIESDDDVRCDLDGLPGLLEEGRVAGSGNGLVDGLRSLSDGLVSRGPCDAASNVRGGRNRRAQLADESVDLGPVGENDRSVRLGMHDSGLRYASPPSASSVLYAWNMSTWRVLLVDPIVDDRDLQAHVLRSAGLEVIEPADNPFKEAITRRPDAVVVDVSPKRQGSREFVQTLKQDPRTASIPVVVVSAFPRSDVPPTEGFVAKPCSPKQIVAEVIRVVKDRPLG